MNINITSANFPDYAFRELVVRLNEHGYLDSANYYLDLTEAMIGLTGYSGHAVEDFTGLELLTNVTGLNISCANHNSRYIKTPQDLVLKSPYIVTLNCYNCWLTSLNATQLTNLQNLNITGNHLKALNLDGTKISSITGKQYPYVSEVVYTGTEDFPYQIDLRSYVGNSNINRISNPSAWKNLNSSLTASTEISSTYSNGILKLNEYPRAITYKYATTINTSVMMDVQAIIYPYINEDDSLSITKGVSYSHILSNELKTHSSYGNYCGKAVRITSGNYVLYRLDASELTKNVTWSIVSGKLPDGLTLNPNTGEISGTTS